MKESKPIEEYKILTFLAIAFMLLIIAIIQVFTWANNTAQSGQIGDTIGGLTSPFLNLISALLIYFSFNEQRKANTRQIEQNNAAIKEQKEANKIQLEQIKEQTRQSKEEREFNTLFQLITSLRGYFQELKFSKDEIPSKTGIPINVKFSYGKTALLDFHNMFQENCKSIEIFNSDLALNSANRYAPSWVSALNYSLFTQQLIKYLYHFRIITHKVKYCSIENNDKVFLLKLIEIELNDLEIIEYIENIINKELIKYKKIDMPDNYTVKSETIAIDFILRACSEYNIIKGMVDNGVS